MSLDFCNSATLVTKLLHVGIRNKHIYFLLHSFFFVTLALPKFLALGIRNKSLIYFLLHSFFRNFAAVFE